MTARRGLAVLALLSVALGAGAEQVQVTIQEPVEGQPSLGSVEVRVTAFSPAGIERILLLVDGRPAAELTEPPWRATVDIGTLNRDHEIRAVAVDGFGSRGEASVRTAAVPLSGQFGVSLQQMYVTVTRDQERVLDITASEFSIEDEGTSQQLVTFARGDIPFTAVLLVDTSSSMVGERLAAAKSGVRSFVVRAGELDQVSLLAFADRILERSEFTGDPADLEDALSRLTAGAGTAINDHLWLAVKLLEQRQGRRVAVLLSDGIDSHSVLDMAQVLAQVRRSQTLLYWIWLGQSGAEFDGDDLRPIFSTWRRPDEYRRQLELLRTAVADSGGRIIPVGDPAEIEPVLVDILAELREQYVLGYYPSSERDDGAWHPVQVRVQRRGHDVRTARGYVDD